MKNKKDFKENLIENFNELLDNLLSNSPYYRHQFDDGSIKKRSIKDIEELKEFPITSKLDLMKYNEKFYASTKSQYREIVHTSGTSGNEILYNKLTNLDLCRLGLNEELSLKTAGLNSNDKVMVAVSVDGFYIAGLAYYIGLQRIGATTILVDPSYMQLQEQHLKNIDVTCIIGIPSQLIALGQGLLEKNIDIQNLRVKKLILIGETIRNADFSLNKLGARLQEVWGACTLHSTYGNTEIATSMCECEFGRGGHVNEELCFIEVINDAGEYCDDYESGNLVVTTFSTEGMPLLRYRTGDITFKISEKCECGRTSLRIGPIIAREKNMLKIKGTSIYPKSISDQLETIEYVDDYAIVVKDEDNGASVNVYVNIKTGDKHLAETNITEMLRVGTRLQISVTVVDTEKLKKIHYLRSNRKPSKIILEYE